MRFLGFPSIFDVLTKVRHPHRHVRASQKSTLGPLFELLVSPPKTETICHRQDGTYSPSKHPP